MSGKTNDVDAEALDLACKEHARRAAGSTITLTMTGDGVINLDVNGERIGPCVLNVEMVVDEPSYPIMRITLHDPQLMDEWEDPQWAEKQRKYIALLQQNSCVEVVLKAPE